VPGKWLIVEADTRVTIKPVTPKTITPAAMKNAAKVKETNPTWKCTTEDPFRDEK